MPDLPTPELSIEFEKSNKGRGKIVAKFPDGGTHVDRIDISDAKARKKFASGLCEGREGLVEAEVLEELDRIAGSLQAHQSVSEDDAAESPGRPSQATVIVDLVRAMESVELFHNSEKEAFITLPVGDHLETWRIQNKAVREWLARLFYLKCNKAVGSQALQDAMGTLVGVAKYEGPERGTSLRIAEHEGETWLDLCNERWEVVRVGKDGWEVVSSQNAPVRFIRRKGMEALPNPVRGGSIKEIRPLVNFDDDQFVLAIGWLVGAFRPRGPYAVLAVCGEQGSAKTTACKLLRRLIDPNVADLRRPPRDERDVFIAGSNSWILACNNVSGLTPQISDALCALATDGGFSTRTLYENDDETLFNARRPVILNGIEEPATRSDLVDRSIGLMLARITEENRLDEEEVMARYEVVRARVLGAILTAVSAALRNRSSVKLTRKPRMADLATWVTAAEPALGWRKELFVDVYMRNRAESHVDVVEASPIGPVILALTQSGPVVGTAAELLAAFNNHIGEHTRPPSEWPKGAKALGGMIRRLGPNLRAVGLLVELPDQKGKGHLKRHEFRLERVAAQPSASSAPPAASVGGPFAVQSPSPTVRTSSIPGQGGAAPCAIADGADHADRCAGAFSSFPASEEGGGPSVFVGDASAGHRALARPGMHRQSRCGHTRWWRPRGEDGLPTCGVCHFPASGLTNIEWLGGEP